MKLLARAIVKSSAKAGYDPLECVRCSIIPRAPEHRDPMADQPR
jgi:hypothetical protein